MYPTYNIPTNFCIHFVYKMYTQYLHTKCIPHFDKLLYLYILYTKFSWHSSFDFLYKIYTKVCRNVVYILYTFCIHQLYTSCTIFVYKMYTQFPCALKMMKNAFYFMSKAIFVLKIFKFSF